MAHPSDTTAVIKTFERPECARRLVEQLRARYPYMPIVVVDDSKSPTIIDVPGVHMCIADFDIGISAGRNLGFSFAKTKYVFTCDDDNVVIDSTDLGRAEKLLVASKLDMLGIHEVNCEYFGTFAQEGDTVRYERANRGEIPGMPVTRYDFIPNLFIATKEAVSAFPWDPELKTGEHFAYFFSHRDKLQVGYTSAVSMGHEPISNHLYMQYRSRADGYVKDFMRKNGIKHRIDLNGNSVDV